MTHIHHKSYISPGVVDGSVMHRQAEWRRDHRGENTIVHAHAHSVVACNNDCKVYEVGYQTRSVAEQPVPIYPGTSVSTPEVY